MEKSRYEDRNIDHMLDVPSAVKSALAERGKVNHMEIPAARVPSGLSEGDFRVVEASHHGTADRRICLLLRIDQVDAFSEVLLCHSFPELATDHDIILPTELTSAHYDLVVQTDLRSTVSNARLGEPVGHLAKFELITVKSLATSPAATFNLATGTSLSGMLDRRWSFKKLEGDALRNLVAPCED